MALREDERIEAAADVLSRMLDGEAVLLHLGSGVYFGLNDVGSFVWDQIREGATVGELRARIIDRFDVDETTAQRDLDELLADLGERELIVRGAEQS